MPFYLLIFKLYPYVHYF